MVNMADLKDALAELKALYLKKNDIDHADVVEIADDYGLNDKLLARKFKESYPNGVGKFPTMDDSIALAVDRKVAEMCERFAVPLPAAKVSTIRGQQYTIICRISNYRVRKHIAVCHADGIVYRLHI